MVGKKRALIYQFSLLAMLVACLLLMPRTARADSIASGTWGTCPWEISADGVLTVHPGKGTSQPSSGEVASPWEEHADSITSVVFTAKDGNKVIAPTSIRALLRNLSKATTMDFSGLDTSGVEDMSSLFYGCSSVKSLDLSGFDTSHVTNMNSMFFGCGAKTINLTGWDTSSVKDMTYMFYACGNLASLDLSGFDTSCVTNMGAMFGGCKTLKTLDVTSFDTSRLNGYGGGVGAMFYGCSSLVELDLSSWCFRYMSMDGMFQGCSSLKTVYVGSCWQSDYLSTSENVFKDCTSIVGGNGTAYNASHADSEYARIDKDGKPGYFTWKDSAHKPFSDCTAETPHFNDVLWLYANGISTGFPDGTFQPYANVARCDMAAFLYRMAGSPDYTPSAKDKAYFSDVNAETPHAREIWWLASKGISRGWDEKDGTHTFRPYSNVARCDMAAFLYRLAGEPDFTPSAAERKYFSDIDSSTPHANEVWWLASMGVSKGWDEKGGTHTFRPYSNVARCDMAAFLFRMETGNLVPMTQ